MKEGASNPIGVSTSEEFLMPFDESWKLKSMPPSTINLGGLKASQQRGLKITHYEETVG